MDLTAPSLYLLTAPSGAGKTAFCRALVDEARSAGWDVAGLLSPAVFENGERTSILAQDLRTGETRLLAYRPPSSGGREVGNEGISQGRWLFSPATLAWGNRILASCLPCDLFIVDELGPLELIRNEGWTNALPALRLSAYRIGVVVVRPSLLESAQSLLPESQVFPLMQNSHPHQIIGRE